MKKIAIFGYGGHAKEVYEQIGQNATFFVDNIYANTIAKPITEFDPSQYSMIVAVADSKKRYDIIKKLPKETEYFTFIHPTAIVYSNVEIGRGSFIGAYSILTTNIKIGDHAILNRGNHIGHDTIIGDYFSAMPGAIVSGNVTIEDLVYMGTNSSIKEKVYVHSLVTIGSNAAVVNNIINSGIYVGVPAKKLNI